MTTTNEQPTDAERDTMRDAVTLLTGRLRGHIDPLMVARLESLAHVLGPAPRFPALNGEPVTDADARKCREDGHATHLVDGKDNGLCPRCGDPNTPPINVAHRQGYGWVITARGTLTDAQAAGITFRAGLLVKLGEFAEVVDDDGIRIGHVKTATYHERVWGEPYTVVGLELR